MTIYPNIDTKQFKDEGYTVVKNVFTKDEIENFRIAVAENCKKDKAENKVRIIKNVVYAVGDLLSKAGLDKVVFDERVITIFKKTLGENLIYYGDSTYQIGGQFTGFHRDMHNSYDQTAKEWQGEYTLARMAIYLQDHAAHSGGLKIKIGSHKNLDGKPVFCDTEIGDVVVWYMRTLHSGNAVRLKLFPNLSIFNTAGKEKLLPKFIQKNHEKERIALFLSFALPSVHYETFKTETAIEEVYKNSLSTSRFNFEAAKKLAENKGVQLDRLYPNYGD